MSATISEESSPSIAPADVPAWGCVVMLAKREWVRFFRQRNRVIGALLQPILFWLLFGTGMHSAFRGGEQDFMTYYLPGTLTLIVLFTAIFTTISVIEDRKEGFLQNVLVAPVPRWTIVAGKVLGGGAIAWVQSLIFLALMLLIGKVALSFALGGVVALLALASLAFNGFGAVLCLANGINAGFSRHYECRLDADVAPQWRVLSRSVGRTGRHGANGHALGYAPKSLKLYRGWLAKLAGRILSQSNVVAKFVDQLADLKSVSRTGFCRRLVDGAAACQGRFEMKLYGAVMMLLAIAGLRLALVSKSTAELCRRTRGAGVRGK